MKRILLSVLALLMAFAVGAQVTFSGATAFGAVYDTVKGLPYWGIQPGITVGLGVDKISAKVEVGSYDVADDATMASYPVNINAVATVKDIPLTTLTLTGWLNDILGTLSWSLAPAVAVALGPVTPGVSMTVADKFLLPTTWTLAFAMKDIPVTATATLIQSSLMKAPETVKLTGAVKY